MVRALPTPSASPTCRPSLDSERPFFSAATKAEGSDCAGAFTGPLCFQMVLFSCDTVDTQHLPRIQTLLWGSTEGGWVVGRREEGVAEGRYEGTREEKILGIWNQLQHQKTLPTSFVFYSSLIPCFGVLLLCILYKAVLPSPLHFPPSAPSCLRSSFWLNRFHL